MIPRCAAAVALLPLMMWFGLSLSPQPAHGQRGRSAPHQEAEARFQSALERYTKGDYAQARAGFQALLDLFPRRPQSSAAALMLAKTLYKLQEYPLAIGAVAQLYEAFPDSRYLPEGDLIVGDARFRQGDSGAAADQYARVLRGAGDIRLKARAADRLGEMTALGRLSPAQVERLRRDLSPARFDQVVQFGQVRWAFRLGRGDLGASRAAAFLKAFPDSPYAGEARALVRSLPERPSAPEPSRPVAAPAGGPARLKVGVLCPTSRELGRELRDGALLARDLMSSAMDDTLRVVFEDSQDDPVTSVKLAQKLSQDPEVVAIIGDLTSRSTVPAAAVANALRVPLIAPTASEDGIASIGDYVFQINATPGAQGRRIAEHAFRAGLKTFAVLASFDAYGKHMSGAFVSRIQELGGQIVAREGYPPGAVDFQPQIQRIREIGAAMSGTPAPPPPAGEADAGADTAQVAPPIDGLLVAAQSPDDVILIVSQAAPYRIAATLLGGDGWNSPRVSREAGDASQGALFVSKYFEEAPDAEARKFREAFRARFGRAPNVASALAYDAMACVLRAIAAGGGSRESLRERLAAGQDFAGATGQVLLAPGQRENSGMHVLTFRDGRIAPAE